MPQGWQIAPDKRASRQCLISLRNADFTRLIPPWKPDSLWLADILPECAGRERHFCVLFRQPFVGVISLDVISYLKLSESRLSSRPSVRSAPANVKDEIEPAFVNDNYWAIFPFHVYWDTSANVQEKDNQKLPLGKGTAKLVSVKYPMEVGGYTPGDTWDLYVGSDGRVVQFIIIVADSKSRAT
jgi:hypothetical protein